MEYTLNMVFLTTGGKKVTFAVSDASSTVTSTDAKTLMNLIIARNIFSTPSGDLASISSATLVAKNVTELDVAL